jgi:YggT family protein
VFVVGNFVGAVAWLVDMVLNLLLLVILLNAVLSWFRLDPSNPVLQLLDRISDFVCNPIRRLFPTMASGIDFAPMIAMVALMFLQRFIVASLQGIAARMG